MEELKQMDQRTRKLLVTRKALHPRDDIDRLYVSRKEGGRGLTSIEDSVNASIQRLEGFIYKCRGRLVTVTINNTDNTKITKNKNGRKNSCMVKLKKSEKRDTYLDFARELKNIWNIKVTVILIVIGELGTVTKTLVQGLEDLEIRGWVETIQTIIIIIIIMSCHEHGYPWPSLATPPNRSSLLVGPQGYIPYPHRAAVCRFKLVILLLLGHMRGSIVEHRLWARPCFCMCGSSFIVFVMGGRWPYSWCFVGCCLQDLFKIARSILHTFC